MPRLKKSKRENFTTGKGKAAGKGEGLRVIKNNKIRFVGDNDSFIPKKYLSKNKNISKETKRYETMPPYTSRREALKYSSKAKKKTTKTSGLSKKGRTGGMGRGSGMGRGGGISGGLFGQKIR